MKELSKKICIILSFVILLQAFCISSVSADEKINNKESKDITQAVSVVSNQAVENDLYLLEANTDGEVKLTVKADGTVWSSNPVDLETRTDIKGIGKMQASSQLLVHYLKDGNKETLATSRASVTNKKGVTISTSKSGIRIDYNFKNEGFIVPVIYSLSSYGMTATILNSEIKETTENTITKITLLPYWGAGSKEEDGYFVIPDGSGAIINFNNGRTANGYQQNIYDTDGLMNVTENAINTEKALMPIFGIKNGQKSSLAVITGGESQCRLFSFVSNGTVPYNYIYPQFTYRKSTTIKMLSKTWYPLDVTFVSPKKVSDVNFSLLYMPLKNDGDYVEMATAYRNYLIEEGKLTKLEGDNIPIYLDIYGSIEVTRNILGFPITVNESLTNTKEVENIIKTLNSDGINNLNIRYIGTSKDGIYNKNVPAKFKPTSKIGGNEGYSDLNSFAKKNGAQIYPEMDLLFYRKAKLTLIKPSNVAQDVCKKNGIFYEYDLRSGRTDTKGIQQYVLKPGEVVNRAEKFLENYKSQKYTNLSLSSLGSTIYSDYSNDVCLSNTAQSSFEKLLKNFKDNDISLMMNEPLLYAACFADGITAIPIQSSNFDIENESIPFYQIVLHGSVSYSVPSVNYSKSSRYMALKAIETGSSIFYTLSATDYYEIFNDGYEELHCIYAKDWLDEISDYGKMVKKALGGVADNYIVGHQKVGDELYKVTYDDGTKILVNYSDEAVVYEGVTVEAMDYVVEKEGE